jgi:hypothetical protein
VGILRSYVKKEKTKIKDGKPGKGKLSTKNSDLEDD